MSLFQQIYLTPSDLIGIITFWKAIATAITWVMVVGGIAASSALLGDTLGDTMVAIIAITVGAGITSMGFIWNWGSLPNQEKKEEKKSDQVYDLMLGSLGNKRKNDDRLTGAIRSLSDDELVELRQRLNSGDLTEDEIAAYLDRR